MHRPANHELLSPIPYTSYSPLGLKLKIAVVLFMLAAGLALSYYGHTVLRETASEWLLLIYLSAAALPALALFDLWRYRWRWLVLLRKMASPLAHQLPPRQPPRHSLRCTTNSALNQFIRLLILGAMLAALATGLGAGELREKLLLLVLVLGLIGDSACAYVWRWQRWRYDATRDTFHRDRRRRFQWQEEGSWSAAECCGLYLEMVGRRPRLWLAGPAGGEDVLLGDLGYLYIGGGKEVEQDLLARLSAASGLPVLYRWPTPPLGLASPSGPTP